MAGLIWYKADLKPDGSVHNVRELGSHPGGDVPLYITFQAASLEEAQEMAVRLGMRAYARKKVAEYRVRLADEGRCRCGRDRDRLKPDKVTYYKYCLVCSEGQKSCKKNKVPGTPRDEKARLEKNKSRQRDRRRELRREVLLEVKAKFWEYKKLVDFERWLEKSIEEVI